MRVMRGRSMRLPGCVLGLALGLAAAPAMAEPYLAVREGLTCSGCHVNPTGGGLRNVFGNVYAQQQLPMVPLAGGSAADGSKAPELWTGTVANRFGIGANGRVSGSYTDQSDEDDALTFDVDRVTIYGSAQLNEHVLLYVDQQQAPGGSANREAWVRLGWNDLYVRAGRLFLPFGWRLEDNEGFTRRETEVNMEQGDDGVEVGWTTSRFDAALAVSNGNGGGAEVDDGKLFTGRFAWVAGMGQLGVSAYSNDTDTAERVMFGVFGGVNTGPVTWLAEYDRIEDTDDFLGQTDSAVGLLEANWLIARGHNLKATAEMQHFENELEDRFRYSLVYEFFPWVFTQLRAGVRMRDSDDDDPRLNTEEGFVQIHVFF
jgi:hypothetical protein